MVSFYLASLVVALGVLVGQVVLGHGAAAHDVHVGDGHELSATTVLASVRFWSFGLLAFGLVGAALTVFGLTGATAALLLALGSGVASGLFAVSVITRLTHRSPQSLGSVNDLRGKVGRVVVPITGQRLGQVRVEAMGSAVDILARAKEPLEVGEQVVVEDVATSGEAVVSRAPKELGP